MNLADIVYGPWMVTQEMHSEIMVIYDRHVRGESADIPAIEAALGRRLDNERKPYGVIDGVAVLPLIGVMAKRANLFMQISGGVSTEIFANEYRAALADPDVSAIVINADTPGGAVDGTPDLAELVYSSRGTKPVLAWSNGTVASAGIYVATAADRLYISSDVVCTGSIGVRQDHIDVSRREDMKGVKRTTLTAGKYKAMAGSNAPLSESGRAYIEDQLNHIYSVFVDAVARHRGMSVDDVLDRAADGRVFLGKQGIDAGLVDGIMTFEQVLDEARRMAGGDNNSGVIRAKRNSGGRMNASELEQKYPDAVAAIRTETETAVIANMTAEGIKNTAPAVWAEIKAAGAQAERDRIADVRANALPGHEDLVAKAEADGKSTGADVAMAIVRAERELTAKARKSQEDNANDPVDGAHAPDDGGKKNMKRAEFDALPAAQKTAFLSEGGTVID